MDAQINPAYTNDNGQKDKQAHDYKTVFWIPDSFTYRIRNKAIKRHTYHRMPAGVAVPTSTGQMRHDRAWSLKYGL